MAMQFDQPEEGVGYVEAFRRANSPYVTAQYKLNGLDRKATYILENLDTGEKCEKMGDELMEQGLEVRIPELPGSAIFMYKIAK